ncbi:methyltransferase regulatory domain-containing protein [Prosthecobacter sp.]|uniref:methyltransferase regulatory domain-containing protein n=1 Tax=Prosthecobacter sp. TaxID=1965333 RepID=UPI0037831719
MGTSYDHVPYPCNAYPQTHPGHLQTIAFLRGLQSAPAERCRYLEIGCGDGGNLTPLAYTLPGSTFLGIDLAASSIETATRHAGAMGLPNVEYQALDLMALDPKSMGQWDYIVAHGFFSWVPEEVRVRLLDLCQEMLSPSGVAFISYNAYPGCHIRQMAREMMRYHTETAPDPDAKVKQARALMKFLAQSHGVDDEYGLLLRAEAERVLNYVPNHFYHDDLADLNQPFYLHEFADLAVQHGLQYLGDADYASMFATRYPGEVRQTLASLGDDPIRQDQYLDFIKCRRFRQTLLCRKDVALHSAAPLEVMRELYFSSSAKPAADDADLLDDSLVSFEGEAGLKGETNTPVAKLALAWLGHQWPRRVHFQELLSTLTGPLGGEPEADKLAAVLREFVEMGAVEAHLQPVCFATTLSERPRASAWALYQLQFGGGITTLRHQTIHIRDSFGLWLLGQLDGTKTVEGIAHAMASTVKPDAEGRLDFDKERFEARALVHEGVQKFLQLGLLVVNR